MNKLFYIKLAATNIKKNYRTYIPYLITCIITVAMYYIIRSLSINQGLRGMFGYHSIAYTLGLGSNIVAIFAVIFLFYTNSFLMKQRKKEFGLFNILGMNKKHLAIVIGLETLYISAISLVVGILIGLVLDKVMYLFILKLIKAEITLGFYISFKAMASTFLLFFAIFLLIYLNSLRQIHLAEPIELLKNSSGEKEPKAKWVVALVGFISLGCGYYIALTTKNPVSALLYFFVAVILVIIGTYLIFTSGSIVILKLLRKNKKYFYKANHFISVSGMLYRMKQNAVGLANICILSTMVLVMVSSTTSMMLGMEDIINTRYPNDIAIHSFESDQKKNESMVSEVKKIIDENDVDVVYEVSYTYLSFAALYDNSEFITNPDTNIIFSEKINNLFFITLADYNRLTGRQETLNDNEVILYSNREVLENDTISIFDLNYNVTKRVDNFIEDGQLSANIASSHFVVVKDMEEINHLYQLQKEVYGEFASKIKNFYGLDLNCDKDKQIDIYQKLESGLTELGFEQFIECKADSYTSFLSIYGGFFFIGIFLGLLFIMATILIIYYKQISEGFDDKERFEIMQKVGMTHKEVKDSIRSQILTVFFLPLFTAGMHVLFAFPFIEKILEILNLTNTKLYIVCTVTCFLIFALMYSIIYGITAKVYYRIVKR